MFTVDAGNRISARSTETSEFIMLEIFKTFETEYKQEENVVSDSKNLGYYIVFVILFVIVPNFLRNTWIK